jgi:ABC-type oligopeptide transport system, periplasmic component
MKTQQNRKGLRLGFGLLTVLALGFSATWVLGGQAGQKNLKLATVHGLFTIDPGASYFAPEWSVFRGTYRTLFSYPAVSDPNQPVDLVPDLAQDMGTHNQDLTEWTFRIRSDVRYGPTFNGAMIAGVSGERVTAGDIKYAIERMFLPSVLALGFNYAFYYAVIEGAEAFFLGQANEITGITVLDDNTIQFRLTEPTAHFRNLLSLFATTPVPKAYAQTFDQGDISSYQLHIVTTGPYYFKEITRDLDGIFVHLRLDRNPNWLPATDPLRAAHVDSAEIILTGDFDETEAVRQVLAGTYHWALDAIHPEPRLIEEARERGLLRQVSAGVVEYIYFNLGKDPMGNALLREAINLAVNRYEYSRILGDGTIATSVLPPNLGGHLPAESFNPFFSQDGAGHFMSGDLDQAKQRLLASGEATDQELLVVGVEDEPGNLESVVASLQALGFTNVRGEVVDRGELYEMSFDPSVAVERFGAEISIGVGVRWAMDFPETVSFMLPLFLPDSPPNFSHADDPDLNAIFAAIGSESDPAVRNALWADANRIATERAYWVPLFWPLSSMVYSKAVANPVGDALAPPALDWTNVDLQQNSDTGGVVGPPPSAPAPSLLNGGGCSLQIRD